MPDNHNEELDTYTIPPNFIEGGTLFGGTLKLRNSLEAGALLLAAGLPVLRLPLSLTTPGYPSVPDRPSSEPDRADRRIGRKPVLLYLQFLPLSQKTEGSLPAGRKG